MTGFKQHIKKEQPPICFLQKGCSEKLDAWQSHVLVRKFQVVDLLRKYSVTIVFQIIALLRKTTLTDCDILHKR